MTSQNIKTHFSKEDHTTHSNDNFLQDESTPTDSVDINDYSSDISSQTTFDKKVRKRGRPKSSTPVRSLCMKCYCCSNCEFKTNARGALLRHTRAIHQKLRDKTCEICNYATSRSSNLYRHIKTVHETGNFSCSDCSYKTPRKDNLISHTKTVHQQKIEDLHSCTLCDVQSYYKQAITRHIKEEHTMLGKIPKL